MKKSRLNVRWVAGAALAFPFGIPAFAQDVSPQQPAQEESTGVPEEGDPEEIVVTGQRLRGSVIGDIPPENTLDARDVRATGATSINELLEAIGPQIGSARGRGGERPVLLLNGQRISGFRELRDIPPEAIQRVEILPEEVALKYGYRADQRVVNFVLRPRFRSTAVRVEGRTATDGGYAGGLGDVTRLMLGQDSRTSINLRAETNGALTEAERDIRIEPDAIDQRSARTLIGSRDLLRGTATHNRQVLGDVSATLNAEIEHSEGESLLGLPTLADGSPLIGSDPRARDASSDSAHAGVALNGNKDSWRWSVTGNADLVRSVTETDPAQSDFDGRDRARSTRKSADIDATANGRLFALPAGDASTTLKVGASTLSLDSSRRRLGETTTTDLGRTLGEASANLDLPVSRRNRDFSALGNLTLNANGEIEQLSDFGTLLTYGGGINWSPLERLNLIGSWTREEGAPSVQQLGEPILETAGTRIFDFTRGETVFVTGVTGGNPGLEADRRTVMKLGGNWQPVEKIDLRLRGEYVRSRLIDPISSFPGVSAAIEQAFPERFVRDDTGQLVRADLRPVNFDEARRETIRWGFDFTKPLRSRPPSAEAIQRFRAMAGAGGARGPVAGGAQSGAPARAGGSAQPRQGGAPDGAGAQRGPRGPGGFGGGGFGRFGGGQQGGRLTFSLTHTLNLTDEVTIRPGVPELDYLGGDALGSTGGRSRHELEAQAGYFNNGLGARLSANWRSGSRVDSETLGSLRFSPMTEFDLRLFANLGEQFDLVSKHPWLRGTQVRLEVDNIFDSKQRVRDAAGIVPLGYQPDLLDPLGRTVSISIRKLFLPPPSVIRRQQRQGQQPQR